MDTISIKIFGVQKLIQNYHAVQSLGIMKYAVVCCGSNEWYASNRPRAMENIFNLSSTSTQFRNDCLQNYWYKVVFCIIIIDTKHFPRKEVTKYASTADADH